METGEKKPHINVDYFEDLTGQIKEGTCSQPEGGQEDIGQRIKAIREALGMTTAQLASRMGLSQPRVVEIEKAEKANAITLNTLERTAHAMDCKLVYALVPRESLDQLVEDRARVIVKAQLDIISHSMALEAQSVPTENEKEQFEQKVRQTVEKAGSDLWKKK